MLKALSVLILGALLPFTGSAQVTRLSAPVSPIIATLATAPRLQVAAYAPAASIASPLITSAMAARPLLSAAPVPASVAKTALAGLKLGATLSQPQARENTLTAFMAGRALYDNGRRASEDDVLPLAQGSAGAPKLSPFRAAVKADTLAAPSSALASERGSATGSSMALMAAVTLAAAAAGIAFGPGLPPLALAAYLVAGGIITVGMFAWDNHKAVFDSSWASWLSLLTSIAIFVGTAASMGLAAHAVRALFF